MIIGKKLGKEAVKVKAAAEPEPVKASMLLKRGLLGAAPLVPFAVYKFVAAPWHHRWGATCEEAEAEMPGDKSIPRPRHNTTRAITIIAPASAVWPWLVQMGQGRAGLYTYDWIENLAGLRMHSADTVLYTLQDLKVGDTIPFEPNGNGMVVTEIKPMKSLVLSGFSQEMSSTWSWTLHEMAPGITRLIVRWQAGYNLKDVLRKVVARSVIKSPRTAISVIFMMLFLDFGQFIMERGMLKGIKRRAEALALEPSAAVVEMPPIPEPLAEMEVVARPKRRKNPPVKLEA